MKISIFVLIVCALLSGCGAVEPATPESIAARFSKSYDPYTKTATISEEGDQMESGGGATAVITIFQNLGSEPVLRISERRPHTLGWAFYKTANDSDGHALQTTEMREDVLDDGDVREVVGITLPASYLRSHAISGINLRLDGKNDQLTLKLKPVRVQGIITGLRSQGSKI